MVHCLLGNRQRGLPSLQDIVTKNLTANRHLLGNVAGIPIHLIKPVLAHCSPAELARIEDVTRKQGGVDLTEQTWEFWQRHCRVEFGEPNMVEVEPLKSTYPDDLASDAGNYRVHYYRQERLIAERRRETAQRARSLMEKAREEKEKCKAKLIDGCLPRRVPFKYQGLSKPGTKKEILLDKIGLLPKFRQKVVSKSTPPSAAVMTRPVPNYQTKKGLNKNLGVQKKTITKNTRTSIAIPKPPLLKSQGWKSSPKAIRPLFFHNRVTSISPAGPGPSPLKTSSSQRRPQAKSTSTPKVSLPTKSLAQGLQPIKRPQRQGLQTTATEAPRQLSANTQSRKRAGSSLTAPHAKRVLTPGGRNM